MRYYILLLYTAFNSLLYSQSRGIDSVRALIRQHPEQDTARAFELNELGWQFLDYSIDSSEKYISQALTLSKNINYLNGVIQAKNAQGIVHRMRNEPEKAISLYEEIIPMRISQGNYERLTGIYSNMGSVYFEVGDNARALSFYMKAYENAKKFRQTENQLALLNNLGAVYKASGLFDMAMQSFRQALELNKTMHDEYQEGMIYLNLATVYDQRGVYKEAYDYYKHAYAIFKKTDNLRQLSIVVYDLSVSARQNKDLDASEMYIHEMEAIARKLDEPIYYSNMHQSKSNYYGEKQRYPEALAEADRALDLIDTISYRYQYGVLLLNKADCLKHLHEYKKAIAHIDRGMAIMKEAQDLLGLSRACFSKSEIYKALNDANAALTYLERGYNYRDSLNSNEFDTKIATLSSLNQLDQKERALELSNKEKEKVEAENKRQFTLLIGSIVVGLLVIVLLVFSWRAYKRKKKDNLLLNNQKLEIELKNDVLKDQKKEIEHQKLLVEEKQKEVLDSIHYAQRIQKTLLAHQDFLQAHLPQHFILFKPKDIVSGDFYWATQKEDCFYLAICDSTGHGVPGAFMSLLNISFLNEAINEKNIAEPNQVLNHVRRKLIENISQDGAQDGMDGILLCFERSGGKTGTRLSYAAAQNKPVLIRNGEVIELVADKMPVGKGLHEESFTLHQTEIQAGDMLYLFTDGYADQFGGPKGKKYKYKQLVSELLTHAKSELPDQCRILDTTFETWRGKLDQIDDVTVVGIRF